MSDRAAKAARARKQLRRHQELQRQKLAEAESGAPAPPAGDSPSRPVTAGPPRGPPPRASTANDPESAQGGLSHTPRVPVVPPVVPSAADGAAPPGALDADKPAPPPSSAPLSDEAPSAAAPPETQSSQQPGAFASAAELWGTSDVAAWPLGRCAARRRSTRQGGARSRAARGRSAACANGPSGARSARTRRGPIRVARGPVRWSRPLCAVGRLRGPCRRPVRPVGGSRRFPARGCAAEHGYLERRQCA